MPDDEYRPGAFCVTVFDLLALCPFGPVTVVVWVQLPLAHEVAWFRDAVFPSGPVTVCDEENWFGEVCMMFCALDDCPPLGPVI